MASKLFNVYVTAPRIPILGGVRLLRQLDRSAEDVWARAGSAPSVWFPRVLLILYFEEVQPNNLSGLASFAQ